MRKTKLTIQRLQQEAAAFAEVESTYPEPTLYGVTDGKAIGTYLEHKFRAHLEVKYTFASSNSASRHRLSRFTGGHEGYRHHPAAIVVSLQVGKTEDIRAGILGSCVRLREEGRPEDDHRCSEYPPYGFRRRTPTADFTMTRLIRQHLEAGCNAEDLIGLMHDKNLPVDDIEANNIAQELLKKPCEQGYLTISNALQWRLQYARVIEQAGKMDGHSEIESRWTRSRSVPDC